MPRISAYVIAFFQHFLAQRCFKTVKYFWQQTITGLCNYTLNKLSQKCQNCAEQAYK